MLKPFAIREHQMMKEVLMNPEAPGPEIHYYMIRGGKDKKNVTTWETGTVGGEYIKTYGHYHVGHLDETYWFLEGEGIAVLQKRKVVNGQEVDNELEAVFAIKVNAGDSLFIPSGMGHLVVNIGSIWLVTADDSPVNFEEADPVSLPGHADYEAVKAMHGFGYYIVDENGSPKAVANPNYKNLPELQWLTPEEWKSRQ